MKTVYAHNFGDFVLEVQRGPAGRMTAFVSSRSTGKLVACTGVKDVSEAIWWGEHYLSLAGFLRKKGAPRLRRTNDLESS